MISTRTIAMVAVAASFTWVTLAGGTASAQTIGYGEGMQRVVSACGSDIQTHCKGIRPGNGNILACMNKNSQSISTACRATVNDVFALIAARREAQASVFKVCQPEARRLCKDYKPGSGRVLRCLLGARQQVANVCRRALTDAGWS